MLCVLSSLFAYTLSLHVYADSLSKYRHVDTAFHVDTLTLLKITSYANICIIFGFYMYLIPKT